MSCWDQQFNSTSSAVVLCLPPCHFIFFFFWFKGTGIIITDRLRFNHTESPSLLYRSSTVLAHPLPPVPQCRTDLQNGTLQISVDSKIDLTLSVMALYQIQSHQLCLIFLFLARMYASIFAHFAFRNNLIVMKNCNVASRAAQSNSAWLALIVHAYTARNRAGRGGGGTRYILGWRVRPGPSNPDPVVKTKLVRLMIPCLRHLTPIIPCLRPMQRQHTLRQIKILENHTLTGHTTPIKRLKGRTLPVGEKIASKELFSSRVTLVTVG